MDGIRRRHSRGCPSLLGKRCNCGAGWEAAVYDEDGRKIRRTFPTEAAARSWRIDSLAARQKGEFRAPARRRIREAGKALIDGMERGVVRTRSGELYKPSAIRSYETSLRVHIYPDLGGASLGDVRRGDVQALADRMLATGANPSTIRNALMPLRVIFRRAIEDDELTANPCTSLRLPAVRGKRDRIASLGEAARLIEALPTPSYRALWASAFYAGLRLGELRGLRWEDVSLSDDIIHVRRAIGQKGEIGTPKSAAGVRRIPMINALRSRLVELHIEVGRPENDRRRRQRSSDCIVHGSFVDPDHIRSLRTSHAWLRMGRGGLDRRLRQRRSATSERAPWCAHRAPIRHRLSGFQWTSRD